MDKDMRKAIIRNVMVGCSKKVSFSKQRQQSLFKALLPR